MIRKTAIFRGLSIFAVSAWLLTGCAYLIGPDCTTELGVEIRPREQTMRVGQEFTAQATGISCGGRERFPYSVTWSSTDPGVAQVDATTGRVCGVSPGTARIQAHDVEGLGGRWGEIHVTVRP
jgi:hypothetical protein